MLSVTTAHAIVSLLAFSCGPHERRLQGTAIFKSLWTERFGPRARTLCLFVCLLILVAREVCRSAANGD